MLIRWANINEKVEHGYHNYGEYDVLSAVDRMSGYVRGIIGFNRETENIDVAKLFIDDSEGLVEVARSRLAASCL